MTEPTLGSLDKGQAVIIERIEHIREDVHQKHLQNRSDVHKLYNMLQLLTDDMWSLKIRITAFSTGAGIVTTCVVKLIDHFWK